MTPQPPVPRARPRVIIGAVITRASEVTDEFHRSARAFRNRLFITLLLILTVAIGLVLLQWRLPNAAIFEQPPGTTGIARWTLMLLVMIFGSLGALVTAIPSMSAIRRVASPFNFPLQQALVKISFGSLTALVGVVAIGADGVTKGFTSLQSLITTAIIFGAGQQLVTRFLDKRAGEIIDAVPAP